MASVATTSPSAMVSTPANRAAWLSGFFMRLSRSVRFGRSPRGPCGHHRTPSHYRAYGGEYSSAADSRCSLPRRWHFILYDGVQRQNASPPTVACGGTGHFDLSHLTLPPTMQQWLPKRGTPILRTAAPRPGHAGARRVRTDGPLELLLQEDVTVVRDEPDECRVVLALLNPGRGGAAFGQAIEGRAHMFSTPLWIHVAPADPVATHSKAPSIAPTTPRLASSSTFSGSMDRVTVPSVIAAMRIATVPALVGGAGSP